MSKTKSLSLFSLLAVTAVLVEVYMVNSSYFLQHSDIMSLAITIDLTFIIPFLFFLLVVRKKVLPPTSLIVVFILSLLISRQILPADNQEYLTYIALIAPIAELIALIWLLSKVRTVIKNYREARTKEFYSIDAFHQSLNSVLGSPIASSIIATELTLLKNAFFGWFARFKAQNTEALPFYIHKRNHYSAFFGIIVFLMLVEMAVLHVIVSQYSQQIAYIITALSIYCFLWFVGDYHEIRLQPVILDSNHLYLRSGIRWKSKIALGNIKKIDKPAILPIDKMYLNTAIIGKPGFVIHLHYPVMVYGLFGIKKRVNQIGLSVDEEAIFLSEIESRLA